MKLLHILLSILGLGILTACKKSGYEKKGGAVYFKDYQMRGADYATFEILNKVFGKDNQQAYYRGVSLAESEPASFAALDEYYAKDSKTVFFCDNYLDFKLFETRRKNKIIVVAGADAGSFTVIPNAYTYARDQWRAYYQGQGFAVRDVASFEPLDYPFGRDKQTGYAHLKPIPDSHGLSFRILSQQFAADNQHVYYAWSQVDGPGEPGIRVINSADPASFKPVGRYHATDKTHAYFKDNLLEAADPASFKPWSESDTQYATDTAHVYFEQVWMKQADRASFIILTDGYGRDKNTVFFVGKALVGCDIATFQVLELEYAKDAKRIYFRGNSLRGADPASFALVGNEDVRDAADKTNSYLAGQRVKPDKNE